MDQKDQALRHRIKAMICRWGLQEYQQWIARHIPAEYQTMPVTEELPPVSGEEIDCTLYHAKLRDLWKVDSYSRKLPWTVGCRDDDDISYECYFTTKCGLTYTVHSNIPFPWDKNHCYVFKMCVKKQQYHLLHVLYDSTTRTLYDTFNLPPSGGLVNCYQIGLLRDNNIRYGRHEQIPSWYHTPL